MHLLMIAGITSVSIAVIGIALPVILHVQFRLRLKRQYPEIHKNMFPRGSIGWNGGKELEQSIYDSEDSKLIKLYKAANMAPAITFICFALVICTIILVSKLSN